MKDADYFWAALLATGTAVETWALVTRRDQYTLSRSARRALRCHTRAGRIVTTSTLSMGAAWLTNHLLSVVPEEIT